MNYRKIMLVALVLLVVLTLGAVSAADIDDSDGLTVDNVENGNLLDSPVEFTDLLSDDGDGDDGGNGTSGGTDVIIVGNGTDYNDEVDDEGDDGNDEGYEIETIWVNCDELSLDNSEDHFAYVNTLEDVQGHVIVNSGEKILFNNTLGNMDHGFDEQGNCYWHGISLKHVNAFDGLNDEDMIVFSFFDENNQKVLSRIYFIYFGENTIRLDNDDSENLDDYSTVDGVTFFLMENMNIWDPFSLIKVAIFPDGIADDFSVSLQKEGGEPIVTDWNLDTVDRDRAGYAMWNIEQLGIVDGGEYSINFIFTIDDNNAEINVGNVNINSDGEGSNNIEFWINTEDLFSTAPEELSRIFATVAVPEGTNGYVAFYNGEKELYKKNINDFDDGRINGNIYSIALEEDGNFIFDGIDDGNYFKFVFLDDDGNEVAGMDYFIFFEDDAVRFEANPHNPGDHVSIDVSGEELSADDENDFVWINLPSGITEGKVIVTSGDYVLFMEDVNFDDGSHWWREIDEHYVCSFAPNSLTNWDKLNDGDAVFFKFLDENDEEVACKEYAITLGEDTVRFEEVQHMQVNIWDENDERGTLYTDSEGNVLAVDIPPVFEGNIIVKVNGEEVDNWEIKTDDEDGWAYKDWGLEELGISEAGNYAIELIYDNGEESQTILNETISVSAFNEDTFRAMIQYTTETIRLYVPDGAEGTVTIITEKEIKGDELEQINEETYEITPEDYGNWKVWSLKELGFEADGAFRIFTLTVTNVTEDEVYRYRISHVEGEDEGEGGDEHLEDIIFRFNTRDDNGYMEFEKAPYVDFGRVFIPQMEEFDGINVTLYITLNGEEYATINVGDLYGFYSSSRNALGFEVGMDMTSFNDKDMLVFRLEAEYENGESAIIEDEEFNYLILDDKGTYFTGHDPTKFSIDRRDDENNILALQVPVFSLYCPDGSEGTVDVTVSYNGNDYSVSKNISDMDENNYLHWYLNDLNMNLLVKYKIHVNVNDGEFESDFDAYVHGPISVASDEKVYINTFFDYLFVYFEVPSEYDDARVIVEFDDMIFNKTLKEFEHADVANESYYWYNPSYGPGPGDERFKHYVVYNGAFGDIEAKTYNVTASIIFENSPIIGNHTFISTGTIDVVEGIVENKGVKMEAAHDRNYNLNDDDASILFITAPEGANGKVTVSLNDKIIFESNLDQLDSEDGYYLLRPSKLELDDDDYELTFAYFEGDEKIVETSEFFTFFHGGDDEDPYQIEVVENFDIADPDTEIIKIHCPDETEGYFVFIADFGSEGETILKYSYEIKQSDYDNDIYVTASDLGITDAGGYGIFIFLTDDPDNLEDCEIFESWGGIEAIDYTQFRVIELDAFEPNALFINPIFAVYCPEGNEGNITVTVRQGDEEEPFIRSEKSISDKDDENKLYWTLPELNMDNMGEYFINVFHDEDELQRGMRVEVVSPINFDLVSYLNSTRNTLLYVEVPSDIADATIILNINGEKAFEKSLKEFINGENGTYAPYWIFKQGYRDVDETYKQYYVCNNHLDYELHALDEDEEFYYMSATLNIDGRNPISNDANVNVVNRNFISNDKISIEVFDSAGYHIEDEHEVMIINTFDDCDGSILITVTDNDWRWEGSPYELRGGDGEYYVLPEFFSDLGDGNYEINVAYVENDEKVIETMAYIEFYGGEDEDDERSPIFFNDAEIYTDPESPDYRENEWIAKIYFDEPTAGRFVLSNNLITLFDIDIPGDNENGDWLVEGEDGASYYEVHLDDLNLTGLTDGDWLEFIFYNEGDDEPRYTKHVDVEVSEDYFRFNGENDWGDDPIDDVEFRPPYSDEEFEIGDNVEVAYLYVPDYMDDFETNIYVFYGDELIYSKNTADIEAEHDDEKQARKYPIALDLTQLEDKTLISFTCDYFGDDVFWAEAVQVDGDKIIFWDDPDFERLEFYSFYGNLTTGTLNDPELMGPNIKGKVMSIIISDYYNITDGTFTISDGDNVLFTKKLSEIDDKEYDYSSLGYSYIINSAHFDLRTLPENNVTFTFTSGNISITQKRLRIDDYLYKVLTPDDFSMMSFSNYKFEIAEDAILTKDDDAIVIFGNSNMQSIFIDFGGGIFNVYVNDTKVEGLGDVLYEAWKNSDAYVEEYDYPSDWGSDLSLARLRGGSVSLSEFHMSFADLGITESGTYNIRITHYPDVDEMEEVYIYAAETELVNKNVIVDFGDLEENSTIEVGDIEFNYNETGSANVSLVGAKNITAFVIDHDEAKVTFNDGVITVSGLDAGNYTLNVTTVPEEGFTASSILVGFTVNKIDANLTVEADNVNVGETTTIKVYGFGIVNVRVGVNTYAINCTGVGYLVLSFDAGTYNVTANFEGDKNINPAEAKTTFTVSKLTPEILITAGEAIEGSDLDVTVEIANATGIVAINGVNITLKDGKASTSIKDVAAGDLDIAAVYFGDAKYVNANATKKVTVNAKENPNLIANVENINVGETAIVNIEINANVTGKVTVDGNEVTIANGKGTYSISNLTAGTYTVAIAFAGDKYFNAANITKTFEVSKVAAPEIVIDVEESVVEGSDLAVDVTVAGATGTVNINGADVALKDGKASTTINNVTVGDLTISVAYSGDDKYLNASNSANVNVYTRKDANLTAGATNINVGDVAIIDITINKDVTGKVTVNGEEVTITNGTAKYEIRDLTAGNYTYDVKFAGDKYFNAVETSVAFKVSKLASEVKITVGSAYNVGESFTIAITNNTAAVVTINGKAYAIKDGKVDIDTTTLAAGSYTVVANITESDKYLANSDAATFTVSKAAAPAVVIDVESSVVEGTDLAVEVTVADATGTVIINGEEKQLNNSKASAIIKNVTVGDLTISVAYSGDAKYLNASNSTNVNVFARKDAELTAVGADINVGEVAEITMTINKDVTGKLTVNGEEVTVVNGTAKYAVAGLTAGNHTFAVKFAGDMYFNADETTVAVKVSKLDSVVKVTVGSAYNVGDSFIIGVNATTDAVVSINGQNYTVKDGAVVIDTTKLAAGSYTVVANITENDKFLASSDSASFTISKLVSSVKVTVGSAYNVGDSFTIAITNNTAAVVTINGNAYAIKDGKVDIDTTALTAGSYTVVANITESDKYLASSDAATFTISKVAAPAIVIDVESSVVEGTDLAVEVTVAGATGTVIINGEEKQLNNSKASAIIKNVTVGDLTINVVYSGDAKYLNASNSTNVNVFARKDAELTAVGADINVGEVAEITMTINKDVIGKLIVNGEEVTVVDGTAKYPVAGLTAGNHTFTVKFAGDKYFNAAETTVVVKVSKVASSVKVTVGSAYNVGDSFTISIANSTAVKVVINGQEYAVKDGAVVIDTTKLAAGSYVVVASIAEDDMFLASSDSASFEVSKVETPAGENPFNFDENKTVESKTPTYSIDLPQDATGTLTVTIDGKNYTAEVKDGKATVEVKDMPAGSYDVTITYSGDDKYSPIVKTSKATVKVDPRIVAKNAKVQYTAGKYYSVTVYGDDGKVAPKGTQVIFTLNGKKVKTTTTDANGVAKFKVTQVPVTNAKIVAKALGVTATKKLTITHAATLKTVTVKKSAKKITLKVTVKVNGKAVKNKVVKFKFNNKNIKTKKALKTDKNGVATVDVPTDYYKNLNVGKTVTYQVTYLKDTVKKSTKVKA